MIGKYYSLWVDHWQYRNWSDSICIPTLLSLYRPMISCVFLLPQPTQLTHPRTPLPRITFLNWLYLYPLCFVNHNKILGGCIICITKIFSFKSITTLIILKFTGHHFVTFWTCDFTISSTPSLDLLILYTPEYLKWNLLFNITYALPSFMTLSTPKTY